MKYIAGFDVGGTKCAVTLAKTNGSEIPEIISKSKFPTEADKPYKVLEQLKNEFDIILKNNELKYSNIIGIGISCGGPLNSETGTVMCPPNLPAWDNIKICEYFEKTTGIPCRLQNDANACAIAEWKYGAGKGLRNMVFLTFGTGLGAGLILDGKLYRGTNDNAGEIGHVRLESSGPIGYGKAGSCEGFCSGGGIRQMGIAAMRASAPDSALYKACEGKEENINAKIIANLAHSKDEICLSIYNKCAEKLGMTISILCDILDPQAVVIGGIYMRSDDLLADKMLEIIKNEALIPCKVLKAGLGERVGDYAALAVAEGNY